MKKTIILSAGVAFGLMLGFVEMALAADPSGIWLRENGASRVRFAACGSALCGTIVWLKEPGLDKNNPNEGQKSRSLVGTRVFYDMAPNGENKWSGKAYNPEDGRTYSGNMTLSGDSLSTQGCALAGLICRTVTWSRAN